MAKLYPPHIEASLPAFSGALIRIPFIGSRAVAFNGDGVTGMVAQFKDVVKNTVVATMEIPKQAIQEIANNTYEIFANPGCAFTPGAHYKIQLAYKGISDLIGHFSDAGIIKYIQEPKVEITVGSGFTQVVNLSYYCIDINEKLYSTQFFLTKLNSTMGWSSGEIIHNTKLDTSTRANETYEFNVSLGNDEYEVYAIITTSSGYTMESPHQRISPKAEIPVSNSYGATAELDYDNGCVNIGVYSDNGSRLYGSTTVLRADAKENYSIWHVMNGTVADISSSSKVDTKTIWRDFTVEQGCTYKYAISWGDSSGNISTKSTTNAVYVDFEDSFLFDGEKQLKIRYNPKVSSFKTTIQEAKTETIGSKYPYFQRNGNTGYREFAISGLLSHLSDEKGYFNASLAQAKELDNEFGVDWSYRTNLNGANIAMERQFKIEVLDWLNNGKPKLFRSPTEGNYFVRLMNVSLSPTDQLGRMLHTFTATAYELGPATPEELARTEYKILRSQPLEGIVDFESQVGTVSYRLAELASNAQTAPVSPQITDLITDHPELQGKRITKAAFYCQYQPSQQLYLTINGKPTNIYLNRTYDGLISSIRASTDFAPGNYDMAILSYQNVLSLDELNKKIETATTNNNLGQWFGGFNLLDLFSCFKNFFQKIHKLICKVREVITIIVDWTLDTLHKFIQGIINKSKNFIAFIKDLIKKIRGEFHESCIYKIMNSNGDCCFFDGFSESIIDEDQPCLIKEFFSATGEKIKNEVTVIKDTVTLYAKDLASNIKNIITNPFVCLEMIYREQENILSLDWLQNSNAELIFSDGYAENDSLSAFSNQVHNIGLKLGEGLAYPCEVIFNTIKENLNDGKILGLDVSNVKEQIKQTNTAITEKAETAVKDFLGLDISTESINKFASSTFKSIIECSKNLIKNTFNSFKGLFGGVLC